MLVRATPGRCAAEIAQLLGWSTATVHVPHSCRAREGDAVFALRGRGGRHRPHLTPQQRAQRLAPFVKRAGAGGRLTVAGIQRAYGARSGQAVAPSTIYRLLQRHGWRKLVPRPGHPRADVAAQGRL